jgi:DNA-binding transcriptional MerR regulator
MFRQNNRRIELICNLRSQGLTIDQIGEALKKQGENVPRSSIGYYVKKYCNHTDGNVVKSSRTVKKRKFQARSRYPIGNALSDIHLIGSRPQTMYKKSQSMGEIIKQEKSVKEMSKVIHVTLLDLFEKDPDLLAKRLDVLIKLHSLSSYLRIDIDDIIDDVFLVLDRPRGKKSTR